MAGHVVKVDITLAFPAWNVALALAGAILLALLITLVPIRGAAHLRPGDAPRYAWQMHTLGCASDCRLVPASSNPVLRWCCDGPGQPGL